MSGIKKKKKNAIFVIGQCRIWPQMKVIAWSERTWAKLLFFSIWHQPGLVSYLSRFPGICITYFINPYQGRRTATVTKTRWLEDIACLITVLELSCLLSKTQSENRSASDNQKHPNDAMLQVFSYGFIYLVSTWKCQTPQAAQCS